MPQGNADEVYQSTRGFNVIFIHSSLDDAGLDPASFRVYAHLSRRASSGQCFPSFDSIASTCRLNRTTVSKVIKELETSGFLKVVRTPGRSNRYYLMPPDNQSVSSTGKPADQSVIGTTPPPKRVLHPPQTEYSKDIHLRGSTEGSTAVGSAAGDKIEGEEKAPKRKLTDAWCEAYKAHHGIKYVFNGAKDGKGADRLLKMEIAIPVIINIAQIAWKNPEGFHSKQAATIAGFAAAFYGIRTEVAAIAGGQVPDNAKF